MMGGMNRHATLIVLFAGIIAGCRETDEPPALSDRDRIRDLEKWMMEVMTPDQEDASSTG